MPFESIKTDMSKPGEPDQLVELKHPEAHFSRRCSCQGLIRWIFVKDCDNGSKGLKNRYKMIR